MINRLSHGLLILFVGKFQWVVTPNLFGISLVTITNLVLQNVLLLKEDGSSEEFRDM